MHHLSQEGYDVWGEVVYDTLTKVVAPNKTFALNAAHPAVGERILFDFGNRAGTTESPDENGYHWNNWHSDSGDLTLTGQSVGNLITTDGSETGIDVIITGEFEANGPGLLDPDESLLSDLAVETATGDNFHRHPFA